MRVPRAYFPFVTTSSDIRIELSTCLVPLRAIVVPSSRSAHPPLMNVVPAPVVTVCAVLYTEPSASVALTLTIEAGQPLNVAMIVPSNSTVLSPPSSCRRAAVLGWLTVLAPVLGPENRSAIASGV